MMGPQGEALKVGFDGYVKLEFHGARVTSDADLLAYRDLDEALGLFDLASKVLNDTRSGRDIQHDMRAITGKLKVHKNAASAKTMGRFETEMLSEAGLSAVFL